MNIESLLRGVAGRRGRATRRGTTGHGTAGTSHSSGGVGESIGRAVDRQMTGGRRGGGLGGMLRRGMRGRGL